MEVPALGATPPKEARAGDLAPGSHVLPGMWPNKIAASALAPPHNACGAMPGPTVPPNRHRGGGLAPGTPLGIF